MILTSFERDTVTLLCDGCGAAHGELPAGDYRLPFVEPDALCAACRQAPPQEDRPAERWEEPEGVFNDDWEYDDGP